MAVLEVDERMKDPTLLRHFRKEALDGVELRARRRHGVEGEARARRAVWDDSGGVIVVDDMDGDNGWQFSVDRVEKANEFMMPVTLHIPADDVPWTTSGGKQRGHAVPL